MSMRPTTKPTAAGAPSSTIDFKNDFTNTALAASQEETVNHIMSRLDQLQSKISTQAEAAPPAAQPSSVRSVRTAPSGDLHARLAALESVHEDSLKRLGTKLDTLETQLSVNKESEVLMNRIFTKFGAIESQLNANKGSEILIGQIATKFGAIESQLNANKGSETLIGQIATKFAEVESRLKSAMQLHDRVAELETKFKAHGRSEADPEQQRLIASINSKLDILEKQRGIKAPVKLGAAVPDDREARVKFLQARIEKLKKLKEQYLDEDE